MLGTGSQVASRERNQNGYFLRWDSEGFLFDPGEGTQRQMILAGVKASSITRIFLTHFHGDHCLGLPGVVQRLALDRVDHPVSIYYPASGQPFIERLLRSSVAREGVQLDLHPVSEEGRVATGPFFDVVAARLDHRAETFGWRIEEPDRRSMLRERLEARGIAGPAVGELQRQGRLQVAGKIVTLEEVSDVRPGQRFAFVMDTRLCDGAFELAREADMLVCESTFTSSLEDLAQAYGHLTAAQAARIAREANVNILVLTHFSQRYPDVGVMVDEAASLHANVVAARDLMTVPVPRR